MYQEIEIGNDPKTYDDEVILRLKAEIAKFKKENTRLKKSLTMSRLKLSVIRESMMEALKE